VGVSERDRRADSATEGNTDGLVGPWAHLAPCAAVAGKQRDRSGEANDASHIFLMLTHGFPPWRQMALLMNFTKFYFLLCFRRISE
jgi:hypothetical protein